MDYETEYNNRARVPEFAAVMLDDWRRRSALLRGSAVAADLGVPFGPSDRQILDIVWPDTMRQAPLVLFIHGGYWQAMHPRDVTFAAAGCLAHGVGVAFAGYDLAPDVPLDMIVNEARSAAMSLHHRVGRRFSVTGHSAGGHLAAVLTATHWSQLDRRNPDDLVPMGLGISGVYEVEPLVHTTLNDKLGLSDEEARRLSPAFWQVPAGRAFETYAGSAESAEFLRQGRAVVANWAAQGIPGGAHVVEGANHFSIIEQLADPDAPIVASLVAQARATQALG